MSHKLKIQSFASEAWREDLIAERINAEHDGWIIWNLNTSENKVMNDLFHKFAHRSAQALGSPWVFIAAIAVVVVWMLAGLIFNFDTWQLVINTDTTIVTFLMVFLIQNTQNRDAKAINLKLDELIHSIKEARDNLIDLEDLSEEELKQLQNEFQRVSGHKSPIWNQK